jgi:RNA polymerase sigma-70 factor (ECF subfamily)
LKDYHVPDEENLVRRAQQRDEKAFSQLYEAYFDRIYRYIRIRIGDVTEAEDMTQQVFLKVLQSISSFRWTGKPFSAWLFRIAHNQVVDHLRKKSKRTTVPIEDAPPMASTSREPEDVVAMKLEMEQVAIAARGLTEAQREVISLRFAGGMSIAEVAKTMGKTEGAIKALQHSGILMLRKKLMVTGP